MALSALFSLLFLIICALGPQKADAVASDVFRIVRQSLPTENPPKVEKQNYINHFSEVCQDINTGIGQSPAGDLWTELTPSAIILSPNYGDRPLEGMAFGFVPYVRKRSLYDVKACANFIQSKLQLESIPDDEPPTAQYLGEFYDDSYSKSQFTAFFDFYRFDDAEYKNLEPVSTPADSIDYCTTLRLVGDENADSKIRLMTAVFNNKVEDVAILGKEDDQVKAEMKKIPDFYALYLQQGGNDAVEKYVDALKLATDIHFDDTATRCSVNYPYFTLQGLVQYLPNDLLNEYWVTFVDLQTDVAAILGFYDKVGENPASFLTFNSGDTEAEIILDEFVGVAGLQTFDILCSYLDVNSVLGETLAAEDSGSVVKVLTADNDNKGFQTQAEAKKDLILPKLLEENIAALKDETDELANAESALVTQMAEGDKEYFIAQFASSRFNTTMQTATTWPTGTGYTDAAAFTTAYDAATTMTALKEVIAKSDEATLTTVIEKFTAKEIILLLSLYSNSSSVFYKNGVADYLKDFTLETLNDAFLTFCTDKETHGCITVDNVAKFFTGATDGAPGAFTLENTNYYRKLFNLTDLTNNIFDKDVTVLDDTVTKTDVEEDLKEALVKLIETKDSRQPTDAAVLDIFKRVVADFERPHKVGDAVGAAANAATYITDESRMALLALQYTADDNKWLSVAAAATFADANYEELLVLVGYCATHKVKADEPSATPTNEEKMVTAVLNEVSKEDANTGVRTLTTDKGPELIKIINSIKGNPSDLATFLSAFITKKKDATEFKNSDVFTRSEKVKKVFCASSPDQNEAALKRFLRLFTSESLITLTARYLDNVADYGPKSEVTESNLRSFLIDSLHVGENFVTYEKIVDLGFLTGDKSAEAEGEIVVAGSPFINVSADGTTTQMCLPITTVDTTKVTPSLSVLNLDVEEDPNDPNNKTDFKDFTSVVVEDGDFEVEDYVLGHTNRCHEVKFTKEYTAVPNVFAYLSYTSREFDAKELPLYVYVNSVNEFGAYICVGYGRKENINTEGVSSDKITGSPKVKYLVLSPIFANIEVEDDPDTELVDETEYATSQSDTTTISMRIEGIKSTYKTNNNNETFKPNAENFMKHFIEANSDTVPTLEHYVLLPNEINLVYNLPTTDGAQIKTILDNIAKNVFYDIKQLPELEKQNGGSTYPIGPQDENVPKATNYNGEDVLVPAKEVLSGDLLVSDEVKGAASTGNFEVFLRAIEGTLNDYPRISVWAGSNKCGSNAYVYSECTSTCEYIGIGTQEDSFSESGLDDTCRLVYPSQSSIECGQYPCGQVAPIRLNKYQEDFSEVTTVNTPPADNPIPDPQVPQPDPQVPQPDPQVPQPDPQVPQPDPQVPQPDPQGPQPDPQEPQTAEDSSGGLSGGAIAGIVVGVVAVVGGAGGAFYYFRIRKK